MTDIHPHIKQLADKIDPSGFTFEDAAWACHWIAREVLRIVEELNHKAPIPPTYHSPTPTKLDPDWQTSCPTPQRQVLGPKAPSPPPAWMETARRYATKIVQAYLTPTITLDYDAPTQLLEARDAQWQARVDAATDAALEEAAKIVESMRPTRTYGPVGATAAISLRDEVARLIRERKAKR